MRRLGLAFGRRVPLYIGLPIIIASAATGYVASTTTLYQTTVSQTQMLRSPEPSEVGAVSNSMEPSGVSVTSSDRSNVLTQPEVRLPAPAPVIERNEAAPEILPDATTPGRETRAMPDQPRETHAVRSASKYHQARRIARQPKSVPATASNGIQVVPLFGPVFSLMQ